VQQSRFLLSQGHEHTPRHQPHFRERQIRLPSTVFFYGFQI